MSDEIKKIEETFVIKLPQDYIEYMKKNNGFVGMIGENYYDIWKLDEIISNNKDYQVQEFFPNLIYFGSDGGGEAFAFDKSNNMSIVSIPFVGTEEGKIVIADSFNDFLNIKFMLSDKQNVIDYINKTTDNRKLHDIAIDYNWDDGLEVPNCILNNENCDLGTALMLFELAGGYDEYFCDIHRDNNYLPHDMQNFILNLKSRIENRDFKNQSINYIPNLTKTMQYKIKKIDPNIDNIFIEGLK